MKVHKIPCPYCRKEFDPRGLPTHVASCPQRTAGHPRALLAAPPEPADLLNRVTTELETRAQSLNAEISDLKSKLATLEIEEAKLAKVLHSLKQA